MAEKGGQPRRPLGQVELRFKWANGAVQDQSSHVSTLEVGRPGRTEELYRGVARGASPHLLRWFH